MFSYSLGADEAIQQNRAINSPPGRDFQARILPKPMVAAGLCLVQDSGHTLRYTVTTGYIFCSLLVWGKGVWICLSEAHPGMGAPGSWAPSLAAWCTPWRGDAGTAPVGAQSGWLAGSWAQRSSRACSCTCCSWCPQATTVGLGPGWGCPGPRVGAGAAAYSSSILLPD